MYRAVVLLCLCVVMTLQWSSSLNISVAAGRKEPKFLGDEFHYPKSEEGGTGTVAPNLENQRMTTKDDFDKVSKFYEDKLTDGKLRVSGPGEVQMQGTHTFLIDDSRERPVKLRVFVRDAANYCITVVISRAETEKLTHIDIVFRAPAKRK